ncbi:MAG TPA: glycosyltransferase [Candidatus Paceibacterota bacterium]|nr:glycosyltransferase [Candidatus Paceibacterota bacterium]
MRLNLGCGYNKLPGYVNVDREESCAPDIIWDLASYPWPWQENSVDEIVFENSLQQLGQDPRAYLRLWQEVYRVGKPGALVRVTAPHWRSDVFLNDPLNVRPVTPEGLAMFDNVRNVRDEAGGGRETKLGLFSGIDFDVEPATAQYRFVPEVAEALRSGQLGVERVRALLEHEGNVAESFTLEMRMVKPARAGFLEKGAKIEKPPRSKPHVLFVTEEPVGFIFDYNFWGSLEAADIATYSRFHLDTFRARRGYSGDLELIRECLSEKPDLIILQCHSLDGVSGPTKATLKVITERLRIPIVSVWSDSETHYFGISDEIAEFAALTVVWDSNEAYKKDSKLSDRYAALWTPYDTRVFSDMGLPRDIDVCFAGTIEGAHPEREEMIKALREAGINVVTLGSNKDVLKKVSIQEYASVLQRAKISLNFSKTTTGLVQLKGRVFEAMFCGAMLLEQEGTETRRFFKEGEEYVEFKDTEDLIAKVKQYLADDAARERVAKSGQRAALEKYSPRKYWMEVFRRVLQNAHGF